MPTLLNSGFSNAVIYNFNHNKISLFYIKIGCKN